MGCCVTRSVLNLLSRHFVALATALILLCAASVSSQPQPTPVVSTKQGLLRGYKTSLANIYKGIPFAKPPVGALRWNSPQPPVPWGSNVKNATESGPGCPQVNCDHTTPKIACPTKTAEDCLYLDVFAPLAAKNGTNLPVMLFISGGNFFYMSGSSRLYDGQILVSRGNVILVNINYRLGALGFLVTGRGPGYATGNYGLLDQRVAFQWVRENIKGFGGDPDKVTLFGQSAGSQSILHHLTSSKSSGYFRGAILESDPITLPYRDFDEAFVLGGLLAEQLNCGVADMKCLRSRSALDVAKASSRTRSSLSSTKILELFEPYGPYVDDVEVKGQPIDVIKKSGGLSKPVVMGSLTEETVLYIYSAFNASVSLEEYLGLVALLKADKAPEVLLKYPPDIFAKDQRPALIKLSTDYVFSCPTRYVVRDLVTQKGVNVWLYVWNHAMSFPAWGKVTYCEGRVCHGSELAFVFDTAYLGNFTMTADETILSHDVIEYWTNFAWSGNPNTKTGTYKSRDDTQTSLMNWPRYENSTKWSSLMFETPQRKIVNGYKTEMCDFWDSIGYRPV